MFITDRDSERFCGQERGPRNPEHDLRCGRRVQAWWVQLQRFAESISISKLSKLDLKSNIFDLVRFDWLAIE